MESGRVDKWRNPYLGFSLRRTVVLHLQQIKVLMKESRLTTRQKSGFESILRTGSSLPRRSEDVARNRQYFSDRHAAKGLAMGLDVRYPESSAYRMNSLRYMTMAAPCKRSLQQIKESGDLSNHNSHGRNYMPLDKEKEKERFANKMAFGKNPHEAITHHDNRTDNKDIPHLEQATEVKYPVNENRVEELIDEIKDRVDFLKSMQKIGREKTYHAYIVCQIQQKIDEIHSLNPGRVSEVINNCRLTSVDKCFLIGHNHVKNIFE